MIYRKIAGIIETSLEIGSVAISEVSGYLRINQTATAIDDIVTLVSKAGSPALPAVDGSQLTGITPDLSQAVVDDNDGSIVTSGGYIVTNA